jgi:hypothetical protein
MIGCRRPAPRVVIFTLWLLYVIAALVSDWVLTPVRYTNPWWFP